MAEEAGSQIGDAFVSIGGSRDNLTAALKTATKQVSDWVTRSSAAMSNIRAPGGGGLGGFGGGAGGGGGLGGAVVGGTLSDSLRGLQGAAAGGKIADAAKFFGKGGKLARFAGKLGGLFKPLTFAIAAVDFAGIKKESEQLGIAIGRLGGNAAENFDKAIDAVMKTRAATGGFGGGSELGSAVPYREAIRAQTILAQAGVGPNEKLLQQIAGHASATGKSIEEVATIFTQLRQGGGDLGGLALRLPETATGPERVAEFQKQGDRQFKILQERISTFTGRLGRIGLFLKEGIPQTIGSIESIVHDFNASGRNLAKQFSAEETARTGMTPEQREQRGLDPAAMRNPDFGGGGPGAHPQRDRTADLITNIQEQRDRAMAFLETANSDSQTRDLVNMISDMDVTLTRLADILERLGGDPVPTAGTPDVEIGANRR